MFAFPAFGLLFGAFFLIWLAAIGGLIVGVSALISVARAPTEAFGPWWDNTKQLWVIGIAVGFVIPFGTLIAGIMWFTSGRAPLRGGTGYAGRPFWAGPPKPPPPLPPPGWPTAGYGAGSGYPQGPYGPPPTPPAAPATPPA